MTYTLKIVDQSIILENSSATCQAEIFCFGGIINSFSIKKNDEYFNVIDAYKNVADAKAQKNTWFKSCHLAPFACRLKDGTYKLENRTYKTKKFYLGDHALHGFMYDKKFEIIKSTSSTTQASVTLQYIYKGTEIGYPFKFTTNITYTLQNENELKVITEITSNNLTKSMPYSTGWHTYFKLDAEIKNHKLQFDALLKYEVDEEQIPTTVIVQDKTFTQGKLLKNINLDTTYFLKRETEISLKGKEIELKIIPKHNYNFLQVFTPDHQQNIALEPLSAIPNSFNNTIGLTTIHPEKSERFEVIFKLETINKKP